MTISPERLELLQHYWIRLITPLGADHTTAYAVFDRLVAAYTEPHRHYHTLEHLAELLKVLGRLANESANPTALFIAAWFHDVIYDPQRTDNEAQSAERARTELHSLTLEPALISAAANLILATDYRLDVSDPDALILRDADWAILGAGEARYRRYATAIRAEYAFVSDDDYRRGRSAVLNQLLARPRLFHTQRMFTEAEAAARNNLTDELKRI